MGDGQIAIIGAQLTWLQADVKKVERGGMRAGDKAGGYSGPTPSFGLARQRSRTLVFFRAKTAERVPGPHG